MQHKASLSVGQKVQLSSLDNKLNMNMTPMQLMQRLYNNYNRTKLYSTVDPNLSNCNSHSQNKYNYSQKMTKFLAKQQTKQKGRGNSTLHLQSQPISIPLQSDKHSYSKYSDNHLNHSKYRTMTPSRYSTLNSQQQNKRCYFKSVYTDAHPFLTTHHGIKEKIIEDASHFKTEPIQMQTQFAQLSINNNNTKLMKPSEHRKTAEQLKQTMIRIKQHKKQRMDKIRYNYLISNVFRGQRQTDLEVNKNGDTLANNYHRYSQASTKQRIFPNSTFADTQDKSKLNA